MSAAGERADRLLAKMTSEEKVAVALGDFDAVAHLGVPPLRYADGPNGIRGPGNVTAFPASLALAATFDEGLAAEYGTAVAEEARDTGSNVLLGPAVGIARVPLGGRLPEAMGEDPYLAGRLAAAEVRAIQDGHVISMVKHFVGNNAETGRTGYATADGRTPAVNTVASERALQELYYPPFKVVVQHGGAGSVMGSYNRVNGTYACQHPGILGILKQDWGWEAFVAPDFLHAVRDPVAAANAGLDIPGLGVTEGRTAEHFTSGAIPPERLHELVRRTLFAIFDAGLDQHPLAGENGRPALASTPIHVALATRIAADGMVLLRNRDRLLPLDAGEIRSVAVLGTARDDAQWVMAGSPCVRVVHDRRVTPLDGIAARAGAGVRVAFAQGSFGDPPLPGVPAEVLAPPHGKGNGLVGQYWNGGSPAGEPALTVVDPTVDLATAPEGLTARSGRPGGRAPSPPPWTGRTASPSWPPGSPGSRSTAGWSRPGRGRRRQRPARLAATRHPHPGGRAAGRRVRRGRGGGQHRRGRGHGPRVPQSARRPGPADRRRGRGQPAHGGGPQHRRPGPDAVAGAGRGRAAGVAPRPAVRPGPGRGPVRRRRPGRTPAGHLPGRPRPGPDHRPRALARQLKGFAKVRLEPGATADVALRLESGDLAAYDEPSGTWAVHPGRYELLVGRSSRDIRGSAGFEVEASRGRPVVP